MTDLFEANQEHGAVLTKNVTGKSGARVTPAKYQMVREAILKVLPSNGPGMTYEELCSAVEPLVSKALFPRPGSLRWYTKATQLDLEANHLIERVPGSSPMRLRVRTRSPAPHR